MSNNTLSIPSSVSSTVAVRFGGTSLTIELEDLLNSFSLFLASIFGRKFLVLLTELIAEFLILLEITGVFGVVLFVFALLILTESSKVLLIELGDLIDNRFCAFNLSKLVKTSESDFLDCFRTGFSALVASGKSLPDLFEHFPFKMFKKLDCAETFLFTEGKTGFLFSDSRVEFSLLLALVKFSSILVVAGICSSASDVWNL